MRLWILTEERPKREVVRAIAEQVAVSQGLAVTHSDVRIAPIFKNGAFTFQYRVAGITSPAFSEINLRLVSGESSFVDYLAYLQPDEPKQEDEPIFAIEETKTGDTDSRNTSVFQRASKFVYIQSFFPKARRIMLYSLSKEQKLKASATNTFGLRMLLTMGVEIWGLANIDLKPFSSVDDLASSKQSMRRPPKGNVPIVISPSQDRVEISARLVKNGKIGHDPNIGAVAAMASCIRRWDRKRKIVITRHGLGAKHIDTSGKFTRIAQQLNIELQGVTLPHTQKKTRYWHYDSTQEKNATILLHIMLENIGAPVVYANHGGTERGYFYLKDGSPLQIPKYKAGMVSAYKSGDKDAIVHIPDLVVIDPKKSESICVEGKRYNTRMAGIQELQNYDYLEASLIEPNYSPSTKVRTVAVFGDSKPATEPAIGFHLLSDGEVFLGQSAPEIFHRALEAAKSA